MPKWSNASVETLREIVREAEMYLQGQVTLATSADQRASALAGIYIAAGAGLIAAAIAAGFPDPAIMWGGFSAAAMFLTGGGLCVMTTLPAEFDLPGGEPENWDEDVRDKRNPEESLSDVANNYQDKIADNRKVLKKNARLFRIGALMGLAAPLIGLLVWHLIDANL